MLLPAALLRDFQRVYLQLNLGNVSIKRACGILSIYLVVWHQRACG